jgi:uncharacterized phage protein (TIGR02218 family)
MTRNVSAGLLSHLAGERTTLAVLCKVTRTDAVVFGFTQHSESITYDGVTYEASTGISATEFSSRGSLNVDNLEVVGALDSATITEADLTAGKWDYAAIDFIVLNYADLTQGHMIVASGTIGEVTLGDTEFRAEIRGLMQSVQQNFGRVYLPPCDADLGDARCGLDLSGSPSILDGQVNGTVSAVLSQRQFIANDIAYSAVAESPTPLIASGWFDYGKLTWTGGARRRVRWRHVYARHRVRQKRLDLYEQVQQ